MGEERMTAGRNVWFAFGVASALVSAIVTGCEYPGVPRAEAAELQAVATRPAAVQLAAATSFAVVPESAVVARPVAHENMQLAEEEGSSPGAEKLEHLKGVKADSVTAASGPQEVNLKDFLIEPETMKVKAGDVKFAVHNKSTHAHNFRIAQWNNSLDGGEVVYPGPKVGATMDRDVHVELKPGTYYVFCGLSDHRKRGMVAKLFVE